jgi:predicted dithiol-disulfide oxidoreductase (DUF899 family)
MSNLAGPGWPLQTWWTGNLRGFHTKRSNSTYARGVDALWAMYPWLDRAPKGRNETGVWWRRHDEYDER